MITIPMHTIMHIPIISHILVMLNNIPSMSTTLLTMVCAGGGVAHGGALEHLALVKTVGQLDPGTRQARH